MPKPRPRAASPDAVALLEADHREADDLFEAFEAARPADRKAIADQICLALTVHTRIEEEILYPAAREALGETRLLDEAAVEHMGAKTLVAQIETMLPDHPLFAAHVRVLAEQVRHHVQEEETQLFPKLRESKLDLQDLGAALAQRKAALLGPLTAA